MTFLVLIVALLVARFSDFNQRRLTERWTAAWGDLLNRSSLLGSVGRARVYLAVVIPVLVLVALQQVALLDTVLAFLVLLFTLGNGGLNEKVSVYLADLGRNDVQAAYHHAAAFRPDSGESRAENWRQLHAETLEAIGFAHFEAFFPVIFWFAVLGAPGALLYRLCFLLARSTSGADRARLHWILHVLDWVPLRLFGLALALVGNFRPVFSRLRRSLTECRTGSAALVGELVAGGVGDRDDTADEDGPEEERFELGELPGLMDRALITWVAAIGLLAVG